MKNKLNLDYTIYYGALSPYFDSLQEGKALASQCESCGHVAYPARAQCSACAHHTIKWHPLSGFAKILFRTDGSSGSFALVKFEGADTNSIVEITNPEEKMGVGKLVAPMDDVPGLRLTLTEELEGETVRDELFDLWSDDDMANIGLLRSNGSIQIHIPQNANIFHMTVGAQLEAGRADAPAMIFEKQDGTTQSWSFGEVDAEATALANDLRNRGYGRGDLIGLHTGMRPETAIGHMAVCKLGATALTLSQLYGPDALAHALNHCAAKCLLSTEAAWAPLRGDAPNMFPHLKDVLVSDSTGSEPDLIDILRAPAPADFNPEYTGADDAALLMYTSGSTGMPKGILHGHRVLASYRPSINMFFNLSMHDEDAVYWSPSDWAWVGGLLDMLFPAWLAGRPVVTSEARFKAAWAFDFMARHKVTHTFLAPTAIKRLAETAEPRKQFDLSLRVICTGGEALAAETLAWSEDRLGVVCNEFYGMTEVNHLIGNCAALYPRRPGSMGIAYPGHDVRLIDDNGDDVADGVQGEIVTPKTAPTRYLGYLKNVEKDAELRLGDFMRTNDLAVRDADGYFWYKGRSDDLIKSSGFRIGPAEIEECLLSHDGVAEVGVIGRPDADRGSVVKAFIRLKSGFVGDEALSAALKSHVRDRLAPYKAPREITYVEDFKMTSSGKINRRALRDAENTA